MPNISWTVGFDGDGVIENYTVEISNDDQYFSNAVCDGTLLNRACVVSSESAFLTELFPWTTYYVRVFARNAVGKSNSSSVLNFTTDEEGALWFFQLDVIYMKFS